MQATQKVQAGYLYKTTAGLDAYVLRDDVDGDTGVQVFVGDVTDVPHVIWSSEGVEWSGECPDYTLCLDTAREANAERRMQEAHRMRFAPEEAPQLIGLARDEDRAASLQSVEAIAAGTGGGAAFFDYLRLMPQHWTMDIRDEQGKVRFRLPIHLVLQLYREEASDTFR